MNRIMLMIRRSLLMLMLTLLMTACALPAENEAIVTQPIYAERADDEPIPVAIAVGAPHAPV